MSDAWILRTALAGALTLLVGASAGPAPPAGAASTPFSVAARAAPIAVELVDTDAPVLPGGEVLYAAPALTRAELDSIGNSAGFAAGPYPGDNLTALMGAFNAVSPTGPVLPEYPFSVSSQYPGNPAQKKENGPHRLASNSDENTSKADAHVGLARGNPGVASVSSTSIAKQDPGSGTLTAQASSLVDGFSLGPTLTVGHVSGHAEITSRPGEKPTKQTSFSVGSITVMGTIVGLTDKGLVPVPGTSPGADFNSLTSQLSQAGVTLALLPANETDTAIDSAGLVIGLTREIPNRGFVKVTITLGRVRAQVKSGVPVESGAENAGGSEGAQATTSLTLSVHTRGEDRQVWPQPRSRA